MIQTVSQKMQKKYFRYKNRQTQFHDLVMTLTHIPVRPVHDLVVRGKERFADVIVECHRKLDGSSYWQPHDGASGRMDHCVGVDHDVRHRLHLEGSTSVEIFTILYRCIYQITNIKQAAVSLCLFVKLAIAK